MKSASCQNVLMHSLIFVIYFTYLIGTESRCPNGTNSETGFTPNCKGINILILILINLNNIIAP